MIDIADLILGLTPEESGAAKAWLSKMAPNAVAFAAGCGAGALIYGRLGMWCFVVPRILALAPIMMDATKGPVEIAQSSRAATRISIRHRCFRLAHCRSVEQFGRDRPSME